MPITNTSSAERAFSLPPNVNGRCRGQLSVHLNEINWRSGIADNFVAVKTIVVWWGESQQTAAASTLRFANCSVQRSSNGYGSHNAIAYNILTKVKLFREYLASCEPIEIKFASATTNIQLGIAHVPIPIELVDALTTPTSSRSEQVTFSDCSCNTRIFNSRNKVVGDVRINFVLTIFDRATPRSATTVPKKMMKPSINDFTYSATMRKRGIENDLNCDNTPRTMIGCKTKNDKNNCNNLVSGNGSRCSTKVSSRMQITSPLAEYLSGLPLTHNQENEALREMQLISPSESFIEALNADLKAAIATSPEKQPASESRRSVSPIRTPSTDAALQKIDSIKISVYDLILTNAGVRELCVKNGIIHGKSYASGTFIVEGKLDGSLLMQCEGKVNSKHHTNTECIRIFSTMVDESAARIEFNRDAIRLIRTPSGQKANDGLSFIVWYRDAQMKQSQIIGATHVPMRDVVKSNDFTLTKRYSVRTTTGDIVLGMLTIKMELGCRGVHFGSEYLEAISLDPEDVEDNGHQLRPSPFYRRHFPGHHEACADFCSNCCKLREHDAKIDDMILSACVYDAHDDHSNGKLTSPPAVGNGQTNGSGEDRGRPVRDNNGMNGKFGRGDDMFGHSNDGAPNHLDDPNHDLSLTGLFYVGLINFDRSRPRLGDTFLVCRSFWTSNAVIMTDKCGNILNFLELFNVYCDSQFFERTKNGFMIVEVWQRGSIGTDAVDSMYGMAKLPLHQFHIAFHDINVRLHVSKQKLPVVSIDGWSTIMAPNSTTPIGTLQVILAIGTDIQIAHLKKSRSLSPCRSFLRSPPEPLPLPATDTISHAEEPSAQNPPHQLPNEEPNSATSTVATDRQANLAAMLSHFIDNLASRLPERGNNIIANANVPPNIAAPSAAVAATSQNQHLPEPMAPSKSLGGPQIRATSDLLDELQRALTVAPPSSTSSLSSPSMMAKPAANHFSQNAKSLKVPQFYVLIEIENALHLSTILIRVNKKCGKRGRDPATQLSSGPPQRGGNINEIEPSTYVTFEAFGPPTSIVNSSDGPVYTTNVCNSSCSPQWNKRFEVYLPIDLLLDDKKRFVLRVWRKTSNDLPQARLLPNPLEDVVIGFVAIDLTVLMAGMPSITGWFNIVDYAGHINGQIKINIQPKEDIKKYQPQQARLTFGDHGDGASSAAATQHLMSAVSGDIAADHTVLSRTLKRKFTELEEITQRLRARLFDVTGDMHTDPDDQFESDLNTLPDEDDDEDEFKLANENGLGADDLDWSNICAMQTQQLDSGNNQYVDVANLMNMTELSSFASNDIDMQTMLQNLHSDRSMSSNVGANDDAFDASNNQQSIQANDINVAGNDRDRADRVCVLAEALQKSAINDNSNSNSSNLSNSPSTHNNEQQ